MGGNSLGERRFPARCTNASYLVIGLLGIHDTAAQWNHGTWEVTIEEGVVSVTAKKAEAQVEMDIQAFTQAFFGVLTAPTLRKQERLQVRAEPGYLALCDLVSGPPMWTSGDY